MKMKFAYSEGMERSEYLSIIPVCSSGGMEVEVESTEGTGSASLVYKVVNNKRCCLRQGGRQGLGPEIVLRCPHSRCGIHMSSHMCMHITQEDFFLNLNGIQKS